MRYFISCPSVGICLMIFSWLDWILFFEFNQGYTYTKFSKVFFSSSRCKKKTVVLWPVPRPRVQGPRVPCFNSSCYFLLLAAVFLNHMLILPFLTDRFRHQLLTSCSFYHMKIVFFFIPFLYPPTKTLFWCLLLPSRTLLTYTDPINGLSAPLSSGWVWSMWGTGRQLVGSKRVKVFVPLVITLGCWGCCMSGCAVRDSLQFLRTAPTPLRPQVCILGGGEKG